MPEKKPSSIFRPGDLVRLIDPRFILRIGYARDIECFVREVESDPAVSEFCRNHVGCSGREFRSRHYQKIVRAVAGFRLSRHLRDGTVRSITLSEPQEEYRSAEFYVVSRHVRYTGVYFSASGGYTYEGEYDYSPAGISQARAHVVLEISRYQHTILPGFAETPDYASGRYVTSSQVEKISPEGVRIGATR